MKYWRCTYDRAEYIKLIQKLLVGSSRTRIFRQIDIELAGRHSVYGGDGRRDIVLFCRWPREFRYAIIYGEISGK